MHRLLQIQTVTLFIITGIVIWNCAATDTSNKESDSSKESKKASNLSEEDIEEWFFHHKSSDINTDKTGSSSLENFLCRQGRMLKTKADRKCLDQVENKKSKKKKPKKIKGDAADTTADTNINHTEL